MNCVAFKSGNSEGLRRTGNRSPLENRIERKRYRVVEGVPSKPEESAALVADDSEDESTFIGPPEIPLQSLVQNLHQHFAPGGDGMVLDSLQGFQILQHFRLVAISGVPLPQNAT